MTAVVVYLGLLLTGVVCFALYYLAQLRIAQQLRAHHRQQWKIIAEPEQGRGGPVRTWMRLQHVLRASQPRLPDLLQDTVITRWFSIWRTAPWLAWTCWVAALLLQWRAR